jgi:hypothetical protein
LIDQTCLRVDQSILIARKQFQFLHDGAIWLQAAQLGQIKAAQLRQQLGINGIGLRTCGLAQLIRHLRIDGIDRDALLQQEGDQ